jgi:hypothetical protein
MARRDLRLNRRQVLAALAAGGLAAVGGPLRSLERLVAAPEGPARWRRLAPSTAPTPRFGAAAAYDEAHRTVLLFSGDARGETAQRGGGEADTWIWDGGAWIRRTPAASPPARSRACLAFHPPSGMVVLFGGGGRGGFLGDTWLWNGRSWMPGPSAGPPPRAAAAMAFDPTTESLVLFGGFGDRMYGDTWAWNGTLWRVLNPETKPLPTRGAAMAYSAALGRLILFGGTHFQGSTRGSSETWAWDGRSWTPVTFTTWPPARRYAALAASDAGRILLFGGFDDTGPLNDTWTLDALWSPQAAAPAPTPRAGAAMAFDPAARSFVLFGGGDGKAMFGDTWAWGPFT